jgi:DNA gyrase subunit A
MSVPPSVPVGEPAERVLDIDLSAEMEGSFLEYAYSVIYSRALPDARDGLKPVQRRILYQMAEMGLRPDRGHVKSARVVGEVMGKLHPHGDAAIYDALVRLAQDFSLRVPLVDGHGNFGSLDDGPAAPRYTEARLAPAATAMTADLDEDVVDFVPNYDGQFRQPAVLPAAFPNLLVNGATGIAVGMATNMPPHNLLEVVSAAIHLLEHPDADVDELMRHLPGPDLPGGGMITGLTGVEEAYRTGRGTFRMRAQVAVEKISARKTALIVTALPHLVGPERVIEKIKDVVAAGKLTGISDVTDLTDRRHGLRLVIGVKAGFDPDRVLEQLYRLTPMEESFGINNVALVDGRPRTLGLRELLRVYLDHRLDVVTRRSRYRLMRRRERLHLVEGLLVAIVDIDEVIQVIRSSEDADQARGRLRDVFDLSAEQAEYILELRLRRLTRLSRLELDAERENLSTEIAALEELLHDDVLLRRRVAAELEDAARQYGSPRRTVLLDGPASRTPAPTAPGDLLVPDAPCRVILTSTGRMLRVDLGSAAQDRRAPHDAIRSVAESTVRGNLLALTADGALVGFSPVDLPAVPARAFQPSAGTPAAAYVGADHPVIAIVRPDERTPLALGTVRGIVKRILVADHEIRSGASAIPLRDGDSVVGAALADDTAELIFVTTRAQLLRTPAATVRPQGPGAAGMTGIRLSGDDTVIFFGAVAAGVDAHAVTVAASSAALAGTDQRSVKVTPLSRFPSQGRAAGGVRAHRFLRGEDHLALAWVSREPLAVAADGAPVVLPTPTDRRDGSGVPVTGAIEALGDQIG